MTAAAIADRELWPPWKTRHRRRRFLPAPPANLAEPLPCPRLPASRPTRARVRRGRRRADRAHGLHLHAARAAPAALLPGEGRARTTSSRPYLEVAQGLSQRLHRHVRTVRTRTSGPSHDSNYSFLTGAPHPERRAGFRNTHLARPVRGRAPRRPDAVRQPAAVVRGLRPLLDPQRRAGAGGRPGRRACSPGCSSRAGPTRSQAQARRLRDGQSILDTVATRRRRAVRPRRRRPRQARRVLHQRPRTGAAAGPGRGVGEEAQAEGRRQAAAERHRTRPTSSAKTRLWFDLIHLALQTDSTPARHPATAGHEQRAADPGRDAGPPRPVAPRQGPEPRSRSSRRSNWRR